MRSDADGPRYESTASPVPAMPFLASNLGATFALAKSRCHLPFVATCKAEVGVAHASTKPTAKVPSYFPSVLAKTWVAFPVASTPLTTNDPGPSWCACTSSGRGSSPGRPIVRSSVPSIGTTVVGATAPTVGVSAAQAADVGVVVSLPTLSEQAAATIEPSPTSSALTT